jgi:hypothetical protein
MGAGDRMKLDMEAASGGKPYKLFFYTSPYLRSRQVGCSGGCCLLLALFTLQQLLLLHMEWPGRDAQASQLVAATLMNDTRDTENFVSHSAWPAAACLRLPPADVRGAGAGLHA